MASVLEKLKALDEQRAQLLEGAKKEALDNAEGPWQSLTSLVSTTLSLRALPHPRPERRANPPRKLQSAKRVTFPAQFAISRLPHIMMGGCIGHRRARSHSASRNLWKGIWRRWGKFAHNRHLHDFKSTVDPWPTL
jgi:hypothetical protein